MTNSSRLPSRPPSPGSRRRCPPGRGPRRRGPPRRRGRAQVRLRPTRLDDGELVRALGRRRGDEVGHVVQRRGVCRREGILPHASRRCPGPRCGGLRSGVNPPPDKSRRPLNLQLRSTLAGEAAAASAEVESALLTPADPTSAAFFDVDNTVMQGASIFHLAKGLHRRHFFTTREILGAAWKQAYFRMVGVEDPEHVADARSSRPGLHRRAHGHRARGARRGDLRRGDGPPDLAGHPGAGPDAPRPGAARLAGHRGSHRDRRGSSPAGSG